VLTARFIFSFVWGGNQISCSMWPYRFRTDYFIFLCENVRLCQETCPKYLTYFHQIIVNTIIGTKDNLNLLKEILEKHKALESIYFGMSIVMINDKDSCSFNIEGFQDLTKALSANSAQMNEVILSTFVILNNAIENCQVPGDLFLEFTGTMAMESSKAQRIKKLQICMKRSKSIEDR